MKTISKYPHYSQAAEGRIIDTISFASSIKSYQRFCDQLEFYRFGLIGGSLTIQGGVIIPVTLLIISMFDFGYSSLFAFVVAMSTITVLVSNISLWPIRWVISLFIINIILQLGIILMHLLPLL